MEGRDSAHRSREGASSVVLSAPAYASFLPTLAGAVLDGSIWQGSAPKSHDLPKLTIYVPTHASVGPLKRAFLSLAPNGATFLPRIHVLGEVDPLDLFATYAPSMASSAAAVDLLEEALAVPQAFDPLERSMQLSAFVIEASRRLASIGLAPDEALFSHVSAAGAHAVARQIAALIDEAHTEGADLSRIDSLESLTASGSEQLSLRMLRSVRKSWEIHKARNQRLDPEERRSRLMAIEAKFVAGSDGPVIVSGSTGSVAATIGLMEAVSARPNAALVLYGLDMMLDEESWSALGNHPEHPQYGLYRLLDRLKVERKDIRSLTPRSGSLLQRTSHESQPEAVPRCLFLSQALRPASTTAQWASFAERLGTEPDALAPHLSLIEADTLQEEVEVIALILRESLETTDRTAALVTPDDRLLLRVRHALSEWGIAIEGSEPLRHDGIALSALTGAENEKPEDLIALLRFAGGEDAPKFRRVAELIDLGGLRQMWRPATLADIPAALSRAEHAVSAGEARHPALKRIAPAEWEMAREFAAKLTEALTPLTNKKQERLNLGRWVAAHREGLKRLGQLGLCGEANGAEAGMLAKIAAASLPSLSLDLAAYADYFREIVATRSVERLGNPHPRIFLWRPLDARLMTADTVILAGLNEGVWPAIGAPDPWLTPRDRAFLGLSPQERRIGQAAHDFAALAASAPRLYLTRSRKNNGSLARPSRWVARIKALAGSRALALEPDKPWIDWARGHHAPVQGAVVSRPEPRPPLSARPRRLSVTAIETWFANPYAIFARHILGLEPLRRSDEMADARDKGILFHAALHRFHQLYRDTLPKDDADAFSQLFELAARELGFNLDDAPFWRTQFARFAAWFAETDAARRSDLQRLRSEVGGKLTIDAPHGPFEITARADRIDLLRGGDVRIYDFKTSANAARVSVARGAPQLALEGLLAREGAFAGVAHGSEVDLAYVVATGREPPGDIVPLKAPPGETILAAKAGLLAHIARFDEEATPYAYESRTIFRDKAENDPYAHLARLAEWSSDREVSEEGDD